MKPKKGRPREADPFLSYLSFQFVQVAFKVTPENAL